MTESPSQTAPGPGATPPPPPGWNTEHLKDYRHLRRERLDRKVAGVAGGLGRHLNVDPTVIRVLFVVLALFGGAGLLLYGALWLLVPEEGTERTVLGTSEATRNTLLIVAVVVAALIAIGDGLHGLRFPWLLVAGLILAVVMLARDRGRSGPTPPTAPPGYSPPEAPTPPAAPTGSWTPPTPPLAGPGGPGGPSGPAGPWSPPAAAWYPPVPAPPTRRGPLLFGPTLALIALALGALGLYAAAGGSVADSAYPALALAVVGVMLLVGAFIGRAGGLIALGLLAAVLLVVTAIGRPSFGGDRNLVVVPHSAAQLQDSYTVPAGRVVIDLSRVSDPASLDGRTVHVDANAGEIVVTVPRGVAVDYNADVQYGGAIDTPTTSRNGWGTSVSSSFGAPRSGATMHLDLHLGFGHIEVLRAGTPVPFPAPHAPRSTP